MVESLKRQLEFQKNISRIAKSFVNIEDINVSINQSLESLGLFSHSSRVYIFHLDQENELMSNTYEWCNEGINAEIDNLQNLSTKLFPWWFKKLGEGEVLFIPKVSELGEEAASEKKILESQGIVSTLALPITFNGSLKGYVGFDHNKMNVPWQIEDTSILQIASDIFSSVFERLQRQKELTSSNEALEESVKALEEAQMKLYQQEKSVAIGQLAAGMAHEINNPLSFVVSNKEFIKEFIEELYDLIVSKRTDIDYDLLKDKYEEIQEVFIDSKNGLQRVLKIVKSLRFIAEDHDESNFELYNFKEVIPHTLNILSHRIKGSVVLNVKIDSENSVIYANKFKMNEALLNVITNALDSMENIDRQRILNINVMANDCRIIVSIKDNGHGMSDSVKSKMFNPFFTTKVIGLNTGLGLNIVYDIIKNVHSGEIEIISLENEGTEIRLLLPMEQN